MEELDSKGKDLNTENIEKGVELANEAQESVVKTEKKDKGKFVQWIVAHKVFVSIGSLILLLICTVAFYQARLSTLESEFIIEKNNYQEQSEISYQIKMDSVNLDNAYRLSRVFSWSVRSELLRGNNEQVSILFGQFIKTPGIAKVSLIDADSKEITLSTDRKLEGETFPDVKFLKESESVIINNRLAITVSGLNDVLGYLYYEFDNLSKGTD